jgi:hypothetical protein
LDEKDMANDHDSEEQWAEASVALTTEFFSEEDWTDGESAEESK